MVATKSNGGWLAAAPNTPTTPVEKKPPKGSTKKEKHSSTAAPTATRPDFHPPIVAEVLQRTPSVRFDLSGSQHSAFTAVGPRASSVVPSTAPLGGPVVNSDASFVTPTTQKPTLKTSRIFPRTTPINGSEQQGASSRVAAPVTPSPRRRGKYTGPVDVDEVSLTESFSSIEAGESSDDLKLMKGQETDDEHGNAESDIVEELSAPPEDSSRESHQLLDVGSPSSPATPLIRNTRSWLQNQKEPFQKPGMMPLSPPVSMRHLMNSGKTLPEVESSDRAPASAELTMLDKESLPTSPSMSPCQLDGSYPGRNSSTSPAQTSDINTRLADPRSPPISPFKIESVGCPRPPRPAFARGKPPVSPPLSSLKLQCSARMLESAMSLPSLAPTSRAAGTADRQDSRDKKDADDEDILSLPSLKEATSATLLQSPPTLPRTHLMSNNDWLHTDQEPFQLHQMMQEEPMSPPLSGNNLVVGRSMTTGKDAIVALSPPASPLPTLEMTQSLLKQLEENQTGTESKRKRHRCLKLSSRNRKKEIYQQLSNARQVVRVILKGSPYDDKDVTSPRACYDAIRHYAELRVEKSRVVMQMEESKRKLKQTYLEWKGLRKQIQKSAVEPKKAATERSNDSMAILQQMLSDDDSVYKEDEAPDTTEEGPNTDADLSSNVSFSLSAKVDEEEDPGKAIACLFQELQSELESIRSVWHDRNHSKPRTEREDRDQPAPGDFGASLHLEDNQRVPTEQSSFDPHPLEGNDSFLLAKIEELTAQIESMEKDKVVLSGYMDQLAHEVTQTDADAVEAVIQKSFSSKPDNTLPENWTTFGSKFPIYRVRESEEEEDEDEAANECEGTSEPEDIVPITPAGASESCFRPHSVLFRSRRFHASNDDHELLPLNMPRSRGVSFERGELKHALSEFSEEDIRLELAARLAQPDLFSESATEDDDIDSEGSLEKKVTSSSFDSFFVTNRRSSEPTSQARRKLHTAFLQKVKSKPGCKAGEGTALLMHNNRVLEIADRAGFEIPKMVLDPYSNSSSIGERKPPALDAELAQELAELAYKVGLPQPAEGLILPPKPVSVPAKDVEEASASESSSVPAKGVEEASASEPSSPRGGTDEHNEEFVRLSSKLLQTQKDLNDSRAQLQLLEKKQKELMRKLLKVESEKQKWKQLATSPPLGTPDATIDPTFEPSGEETSTLEQQQVTASAIATMKEQLRELIVKCQIEKEASSDENGESFEKLQELFGKEDKELKAKDLEQAAMQYEVKELQTQLAKSKKALEAMEQQYKEATSRVLEMEKRDFASSSGVSAIEVKLLEKAEECERLSSQVTCLSEQLEKQMANVSALELQVAGNSQYNGAAARTTHGRQPTSVARLASGQAQEGIVSSTVVLIQSQKSSPSVAPSVGGGFQSPPADPNGRGICQSPVTVPKHLTSPKRNSVRGRASGRASGLFRGIKKRLSIASPKHERKTRPHAAMQTQHEEGNVTSSGEQDPGFVVKNPFDDHVPRLDSIFDGKVGTASAVAAAAASGGEGMGRQESSGSLDASTNTSIAEACSVPLQSKTSMDLSTREDAQLATIHNLTKRIEELEEENSKLKQSTIGGKAVRSGRFSINKKVKGAEEQDWMT